MPTSKAAMAKHIEVSVNNVERHLHRIVFISSIQELLLGKSHIYVSIVKKQSQDAQLSKARSEGSQCDQKKPVIEKH